MKDRWRRAGSKPPASNTPRMLRKAILIGLSVLVAAFGAPAAGARPASTKGPLMPITLGKTNILTGAKTGYVQVSVERPMTLDYGALTQIKGEFTRLFNKGGPSPSVQVRGKGDFIGMAITRDRDGVEPLIVTGQFRGHSDVDRVVNFSSPLLGRHIELKPGTYRIFLIADGAEAEVRFIFNKGTGSTNLTPIVPSHSDAHSTNSFTKAGEIGVLHAVNEHTVSSERAFAVDMLAVHGGEEVLEGMGVCIKPLDGVLPVDYYGPRCGNGGDDVFIAEAQGRGETYFMFLQDGSVTKGRWGFGGWYAGDARPDYVGLQSLTIDRS